MNSSADCNLLFGILAMQMDFVTREQLVAAMSAWVLEKQTPLDDILARQGALHAEHRALLTALVAAHLKQHDDDPEKSLAAVSSIESLRTELLQIADPQIQATLAHASQNRPHAECNGDRFATQSMGESTSDGERFRILRPHAKGGLGEVFVAADAELGREVALKQIQSHRADDPNSRSRFVVEAEITGGLEHPGIVPVYGLGTYANGRPFYAMRFIRGDSLKEAIDRYHSTDAAKLSAGKRTLQLRKLLGRFIDVCNAIEYAHSRGVLHRDLKPGNIMLGKYGETLVVDWGLAKAQGKTSLTVDADEAPVQPFSGSGSMPTQMGSAIGTPQFMSPEQAAGRVDLLGPESDVYSLGATLYCLLTGESPLTGLSEVGEVLRRVKAGEIAPPRSLRPLIPKALEAICLKAMALKPTDRYSSPRALANDLEHWLGDEPVTAQPESLIHAIGRWMRRHRAGTMAVAATLLIAAMAATVSTLLVSRQERIAEGFARDEHAARDEAEIQKTKALSSEREARLIAAQMTEDRALGNLQQTRSNVGLLTLAKALTLAPADLADLQYSIRANLDQWQHQLPKLAAMLRHCNDGRLIQSIALSPNGESIATAGQDGRVIVWDINTAKPRANPIQHSHSVRSMVFSADGKSLVTGEGADVVAMAARLPIACSLSKTVHIWNVQTGELISDLDFEEPVRMLDVSSDGKVLLTASNLSFRLWKMPDREPLGQPLLMPAAAGSGRIQAPSKFLPPEPASLSRILPPTPDGAAPKPVVLSSVIALSPDGRFVATQGAEPNTAVIWSAESGQILGLPLRHTAPVRVLTFSPDSALLATGGADNVVRLWDVAAPLQPRFSFNHTGEIRAITFSADRKLMATAGQDNSAFVWEVATGELHCPPLRHQNSVEYLSFSPNSERLLTASLDHSAQEWDVDTGRPIGQSLPHGDTVWDAEYSPDGRHIVTASFDSFLRVWRPVPMASVVKQFEHGSPIAALIFKDSNDTLISVDTGGSIEAWDTASGKRVSEPINDLDQFIKQIDLQPQTVGELHYHPSGHSHKSDIASPSTRDGHNRTVSSSKGSWTATEANGGMVILQSLKHADQPAIRLPHHDRILCMVFSPDEKILLTAAGYVPAGREYTPEDHGEVRLWDTATGEPRGLPFETRELVLAAAVSPEGGCVATASSTGAVRFWDVATGRSMGPELVHSKAVHAVAFNSQGTLLATGDDDGDVTVWPVPKPLFGDPAAIRKHFEVVTGSALDAGGAIKLLNPDEWERLRVNDVESTLSELADTSLLRPTTSRKHTIHPRSHAVSLPHHTPTLPAPSAPPPPAPSASPAPPAPPAPPSSPPPSAEEQVATVVKNLKELNPQFDGKVSHHVEGGTVTELSFATDNVTNIRPVRLLRRLKKLNCAGSGPGKGILSDLSPLKGMTLTSLDCHWTKVSDLSPLREMSLTDLQCGDTAISDLSPLKELRLRFLDCGGTHVSDLSALKGMPLRKLVCDRAQASDLSPLQGMPLTSLNCSQNPNLTDISPLKGSSLQELFCNGTKISDLSPLKGIPLTKLYCDATPISDLSPLEGMKLTEVAFSPQQIRAGLEVLRRMQSVQTLRRSAWDAAAAPDEFWKKYDAGDFSK